MLAYASVATALGIAAAARGAAVRPLLAATSTARSLGKSSSNAALAAVGSSWPCAFHRSQLLLVAVAWQGCLGVATLMHYVPVSLGVLHQASALVAWTASLALLHSVTGPRMSRVLLAAARTDSSRKAALATVSRMVAQGK